MAVDVGLAGAAKAGEALTAVAVGDVNKDDWPDFFFARTGTSVLALSNGHGRFNLSDAADESARRLPPRNSWITTTTVCSTLWR